MSGDGSHRRGGERLPVLPCCLWSSPTGQPSRSPWGADDPLPSAHGECAFGYSTKCPPWVSSTQHESTLPVPHSTTPMAPGSLPGSKWQYPSPNWGVSHLNRKALPEGCQRNHPTQSKGMRCLFTKC